MYLFLFMIFASLSRKNFINTKNKFGLQDLVQVHHIIPLEWQKHKNLKYYNVHKGYNLIFLPTKKGSAEINTIRRVHEGGHPNYNKYILYLLDKNEDPFVLSKEIRNKLILNEEIPW